jgi:bacterioferritin
MDAGIATAPYFTYPHQGRNSMDKPTNPSASGRSQAGGMTLDQSGLDAARRNLKAGAMTPAYGPWQADVVKLLNGALATELTCVLRYRRHHFTADGVASPKIAEEFMVHANAELAHADRIAERIVQLGGEPDFSPVGMLQRGHADYDEPKDLVAMIRSNLIAERVAVEAYRQMIALIGDKDSTTRRMLEDILADEEEHADELKDWLEK